MADATLKVAARNMTARAAADVPILSAGNSMATLLQSGVGNCFPGLECDLRNLERRFFPFIEVDLGGSFALVAAVDRDAVDAAETEGSVSAADAIAYRTMADRLADGWLVRRFVGDFGPMGQLDVTSAQIEAAQTSIGPGRIPLDVWTAVRLLKEGAPVTLTIEPESGGGSVVLTANRTAYLDPNGALARIFEVGELTQSLCSPWTHDFRDCLCFYWASNHPDIALPPKPGTADPTDPKWNLDTHWERADRSIEAPPVETRRGRQDTPEMQHHEINAAWQTLNFVLERREQILPYKEQPHSAVPLDDLPSLIAHLRFAAGVEIAVMQEYLVAWSSLRPAADVTEPLRSDLRASASELLRIAIGEMRHIRGVNGVLRALTPAGVFQPALQVAATMPEAAGPRPVIFRALTADAIEDFIAIEAPSQSLDSLYGRILASLETFGLLDQQCQAIRAIIAEGEEHWQTFLFIRQWLGRHQEAEYLRSPGLVPAPPGDPRQAALSQRYDALLSGLHEAYHRGLPTGAAQLNAARDGMLGGTGIEGAILAVADAGFLPVFPVSQISVSCLSRIHDGDVMRRPVGYVRGGGAVGLVAALALARRGEVLIERTRAPTVTDRVDSVPLSLLAILVELGIHPTEIGVSTPTSAVLTSWEQETPIVREGAPKVNVDRRLLEGALLRKVEYHPRIVRVEAGEVDRRPALCVDATGRRAITAESIVEPPSPWFARTIVVPGTFGPAQQALRLAPFAGGYVYRLASPVLATVGVVGPSTSTGPPRRMIEMIVDVGCGWTIAGLDSGGARPGRGGKASVQRAVPSRGWVAVGDAVFACDSLSSQGIASGMSSAVKLAGDMPVVAGSAYRRHVEHVAVVISRNRYRNAPVWADYANYLQGERENRTPNADI